MTETPTAHGIERDTLATAAWIGSLQLALRRRTWIWLTLLALPVGPLVAWGDVSDRLSAERCVTAAYLRDEVGPLYFDGPATCTVDRYLHLHGHLSCVSGACVLDGGDVPPAGAIDIEQLTNCMLPRQCEMTGMKPTHTGATGSGASIMVSNATNVVIPSNFDHFPTPAETDGPGAPAVCWNAHGVTWEDNLAVNLVILHGARGIAALGITCNAVALQRGSR